MDVLWVGGGVAGLGSNLLRKFCVDACPPRKLWERGGGEKARPCKSGLGEKVP